MQKFPYLILAFFLLVADQISKWAVSEQIIRPALEDGGASLHFIDWMASAPQRLSFASIEILPFFNIVMVWNQGVSFGMLNNETAYGALLLSGLSLLISAVFLIWLFRSRSQLQCLAIGFVIAGAIGNVIDRVRFGAVVDFLDFHVAGFHWPAFNIADSCIFIGVFLLIVQSFFFETTGKTLAKNATTNSNTD